MEYVYIAIFLGQAITFSLSIKFFYDIYFKKAIIINKHLYFLSYLLMTIYSFFSVYYHFHFIFNLTICPLLMFLPTLFIKASLPQRFFSWIFLCPLSSLTEVIVCHIISLMLGLNGEITVPKTFESIIMMCSSRVVGLSLLFLYKNFSKTKNDIFKSRLNFSTSLLHILSALLAQISILMLCFVVLPLQDHGLEGTAILLSALLLFFLICLFISYINNLDLEEYRTKARLLEQEMNYYEREHKLLGEYLSDISIFKHNVKYQLLPILSKIPTDNGERLKEFTSVFDEVFLENYKYLTQNPSLDMLLNHHLHKAQEDGYNLDLQLDLHLEIFIDFKILSIILGNLLDNAREAKPDDKKIKLQLLNQNSNLFIKVQNSFQGEIILENNLPITTKAAKELHGLGLLSVKKLVEQEGGIFNFSYNHHIFTIEILLINHKNQRALK